MQQLEIEILESAKSGDHSAFRRIVEHYSNYAYILAFRILCNEDEARDTVQDSFIKIWKRIGSIDSKNKFSTWMYKIVTHTAIDQYRKNKVRNTSSIELSEYVLTNANDNSAERFMDNKEIAGLITSLAGGLPEKQRVIFILRDIQGFNSSEVQEILEISEDIVKSNLYHARKSVKAKLSRLLSYERRLT